MLLVVSEVYRRQYQQYGIIDSEVPAFILLRCSLLIQTINTNHCKDYLRLEMVI